MEPKKLIKDQPLIPYLRDVLHCDLDSEMSEKDKNLLLSYIKGLKIHVMIPKQPNTSRKYRVKGLFDTAEKHW